MLEHVTERVEKEMTEERSDMVASTQCEPIFDLIHGIPGAGKSKVIAWICELFTDVLGWESGICWRALRWICFGGCLRARLCFDKKDILYFQTFVGFHRLH